MHFQRSVFNSGMQSSGFTNHGDHDYRTMQTPFPHQTSNYHCPYLQDLNSLGVDLSEAETLYQSGTLKKEEESMKLPDEALMSQELDDLSAVVKKFNAKGFLNPSSGVQSTSGSVFSNAPLLLDAHGHRLPLYSRDSMKRDMEAYVYRQTDANKRKQIRPQISSSNRGNINEEIREESLKLKRPFMASSLRRKSHVLSERVRRSEMNELYAQLYSLLPYPYAKSDKASILSEIINYIQSLQSRLAICTKKQASIELPNQAVSSMVLNIKKSSLVNEDDQCLSSNCNRSKAILGTKSSDENLTVNYNGKDVFIAMNCAKKANLLPSIMVVVESQNMEVMHAFVSITSTVASYCLHVKATEVLDPLARDTLSGAFNKLMKSEFQISFEE